MILYVLRLSAARGEMESVAAPRIKDYNFSIPGPLNFTTINAGSKLLLPIAEIT